MPWLVMQRQDDVRRGTIEVETEETLNLANRFKNQMFHAHTQWVVWRKLHDAQKDRASFWKSIAFLSIGYVAFSIIYRTAGG